MSHMSLGNMMSPFSPFNARWARANVYRTVGRRHGLLGLGAEAVIEPVDDPIFTAPYREPESTTPIAIAVPLPTEPIYYDYTEPVIAIPAPSPTTDPWAPEPVVNDVIPPVYMPPDEPVLPPDPLVEPVYFGPPAPPSTTDQPMVTPPALPGTVIVEKTPVPVPPRLRLPRLDREHLFFYGKWAVLGLAALYFVRKM